MLSFQTTWPLAYPWLLEGFVLIAWKKRDGISGPSGEDQRTVVAKIFEQLLSQQMSKILKQSLTPSCQCTVKCTAVRPH